LPLGGWLSDRYGRLPPLIGGAGASSLGLVVLTNAHTPLHAAIAAVVAAFGLGLTMPASNAALLDVADPEHRALLLSGMMAVQGLSEAVGPLLGGFLIQKSGSVLPIAAAAVALWLAVPWSVLFASAPHGNQPGAIVPYTPLTRFLSRSHIRFHERLEESHSAMHEPDVPPKPDR
ncbi:MAG: MFS transporter, partial [Dehalococcoidia bacterium]